MKTFPATRVAAVPTLLLLLAAAALSAQPKPKWERLMDGKTLAGWHAVGDGQWTVEEGAFVGRAHNEKLYGLLVSDDTFKDFKVRFKFQSNTGDSGFYIRTMIEPPEKSHGLQVQVGPAGTGTGGIYESYGRKWLVQPTADEQKKFLKSDGWNEMVITARGGDIMVKVNGTKTADLKGDPSRPEGQFALQMHAGCEMEVRFKDIAIQRQ